MPSWNIHTAQAERLLNTDGASALGIRDVDAFLLGNLLPDIYVGYMVPNVSRKIPYRETHFADPTFVPEPRYGEFFECYGQPSEDGTVSDLVLGAWAHLVADHVYNQQSNRFFREHNIPSGNPTRIKKQGDFDLFGRTRDIHRAPHITKEVLRQCAAFEQYPLEERDMYATQTVMENIISSNIEHRVFGTPAYRMLDDAFFSTTFDMVTERIRHGLLAYAAGEKDWGAE